MHEKRLKNNLTNQKSKNKTNKTPAKVEIAVCRICLSEEDPKEK